VDYYHLKFNNLIAKLLDHYRVYGNFTVEIPVPEGSWTRTVSGHVAIVDDNLASTLFNGQCGATFQGFAQGLRNKGHSTYGLYQPFTTILRSKLNQASGQYDIMCEHGSYTVTVTHLPFVVRADFEWRRHKQGMVLPADVTTFDTAEDPIIDWIIVHLFVMPCRSVCAGRANRIMLAISTFLIRLNLGWISNVAGGLGIHFAERLSTVAVRSPPITVYTTLTAHPLIGEVGMATSAHAVPMEVVSHFRSVAAISVRSVGSSFFVTVQGLANLRSKARAALTDAIRNDPGLAPCINEHVESLVVDGIFHAAENQASMVARLKMSGIDVRD